MKLDNEDDRRAYADTEVEAAAVLLADGQYVAADETLRHAVHSGATAVDVFRAIAAHAIARHEAGDPPL